MAGKKSFIDKVKEANLKKIESIEDLPEKVRDNVIMSVLKSPLIPLKLSFLIKNYPNQDIQIMKNGEKASIKELPEKELEALHAFDPQFFIDLVIQEERYMKVFLKTININNYLAKAYEAFVVRPDDMNLDEFRATCQAKYEDLRAISDSDLSWTTEAEI